MNEELNLTLAEVKDDTAFDEQYKDWHTKDRIPLHVDDLRIICRLWFGRGVARGMEWANSEVNRLVPRASND